MANFGTIEIRRFRMAMQHLVGKCVFASEWDTQVKVKLIIMHYNGLVWNKCKLHIRTNPIVFPFGFIFISLRIRFSLDQELSAERALERE